MKKKQTSFCALFMPKLRRLDGRSTFKTILISKEKALRLYKDIGHFQQIL